MLNKNTVVARNLSKTYTLSKSGSEVSLFGKKNRITVEALKDVSFVARAGESIGVVGHNGAGKSTLFRLISGGESPTTGQIYVSSQPTLLGVSSALQSQLSGRVNIRLGLLAMGLSPAEVESREASVSEWAEIGDAIDRPLTTYSSGMRARLVFAISTEVRRELLLIDEALSTGDKAFKDRATERMDSFLDSSGTVFLVSHGAGTIKDYCDRALWIHNGEIIMDDDATETSKTYVRWAQYRSKNMDKSANSLLEDCRNVYVKPQIVFESEAVSYLDW
ncbi:ABC transporter ATP-binding protein [Corynebacterium incognita]|uniref:ABC transporter ATP-binding protein n=1 Tax=Corynebacterium incognita TaxID=2754725 RepID=A0A7G7CQU2_9CORY|nr:ABC transporter ATP-binding protein [Corynebacterium incognita]QNE89958.1 ABC transporter ATP-binding protein [Corynebacterium incognita]